MRFGSVCSGIEAASVAFEPLGWSAAWLAEIEPFPAAVLAHHYPDVPNLGDMATIPRRLLAGEIEAPDMLCGGTPCQAFSVAGLRKSLSDERGSLTLKFVEIADAIDHVRARRGEPPAIVLWENVPGVLSTLDNAFGCFLAGLAGEDDPLEPPGGRWANAGAVYGPARAIAWRTLDAQYFGLAQRRRRVFVVASARDGFDPARVLFEWEGVRRDSAPSRDAWAGATVETLGGTSPGGGWRFGADEAAAGQLICMAHGQGGAEINNGGENVLAFDTTQITSAENRSNPQPGGPCHPLGAGAHPPAIAFPARMSGTQCATTEDLSPSLGATNPTGLAHGASVRRLTPRECERLQGFPDDYTRIPWKLGYWPADKHSPEVRSAIAELCPKGPRYKALGNSWAVPCVRWIGRRIQEVNEMQSSKGGG